MHLIIIRTFCVITFCLPTSLAWGQSIIAHRGASHDAPENTLASFRLAWERGADGIEGDFYLTTDGRIVCVHDGDTKRVAGIKLIVSKSSSADLRALDVGAWKGAKWQGEKIPTIEEVLATIPPGKIIFIELKVGPEIVEPLAKVLEASPLRPEQTVIIAFNEATIAACEKRLPHLKTQWLTSYKDENKSKNKTGPPSWTPTADRVAKTVLRIGADALGSQAVPDHFDKAFIARLHADGIDEFGVWTVDDASVAKYYQKLGAAAITTNRPGWLRKQLQK